MMNAIALSFHTGEARRIEVEKPVGVGPTELIVQVKHSAIDTAVDDVVHKTMTGYFVHSRTEPLIVGWHYAGTVISKGGDVNDLQIGDQVWGFLDVSPKQKQGAFAEYIRVQADACARVPDKVDPKVAAAAATETVTALQAMRDYGKLTSQGSVLVIGAGGGVGTAAVGIAKRLGAHVTAVCSTKDVKRVEQLGADVVMDRTKVDFLAVDLKYDLILDTPAKYSALKCLKHLNPKGCYVATLPSLSLVAAWFVSFFNGKRVSFVECAPKRKDLELVGEWLADGLVVDIDSTYPIRNMKEALLRHKEKTKVGRVTIDVLGGW